MRYWLGALVLLFWFATAIALMCHAPDAALVFSLPFGLFTFLWCVRAVLRVARAVLR